MLIARMADAQPQTVKLRRAQLCLNVFQAVVPAVAAAQFEADGAAVDVQFVVHHQNFFWLDFVKIRRCLHGLARQVHVRIGFQQPDIAFGTGNARHISEKFLLVFERSLPLPCQFVQKPKTRIVPRVFVFRGRIAQTDNQFNLHDASFFFCNTRLRRASFGSATSGR